MMVLAGVPDKFWAEAVECATYIIHRTPTSAMKGNKTPLEVWSKKPDVSHFKGFGCMAYAHVPGAQSQKIDKKEMKLLLFAILFSPSATDCSMRRHHISM